MSGEPTQRSIEEARNGLILALIAIEARNKSYENIIGTQKTMKIVRACISALFLSGMYLAFGNIDGWVVAFAAIGLFISMVIDDLLASEVLHTKNANSGYKAPFSRNFEPQTADKIFTSILATYDLPRELQGHWRQVNGLRFEKVVSHVTFTWSCEAGVGFSVPSFILPNQSPNDAAYPKQLWEAVRRLMADNWGLTMSKPST